MAMAASSPLLRVSPFSSAIFLLLLLLLLSPSSASSPTISYADHCAAAIPESATFGDDLDPSTTTFQLSEGVFSGADALLGGGGDRIRSFYFIRRSFLPTQTPGVFQISATLTVRSSGGFHRIRDRHVLERSSSHFHQVRPRIPRTFLQRGSVSFDLSGYWSEASGKLCMVGTGHGRTVEGKSLQPSAVFQLDYPKITNISSSLVKGSLESLDDVGSSNHFDPISVLAYAPGDYEYTQIANAQKSCAPVSVGQSLGLGSSLCYYMKSLSRVRFELDYGKDCSSNSCGPFAQSSGFTPSIVSFSHVQCSGNGELHMYVGFSNITTFYFSSHLVPGNALVSEGIWDHEKQQVCLVACRMKSSPTSLMDSTVDACTIRIRLWFPAVWSIESRTTAVGRIWSESNKNDADYFDSVSFSSTDNYIGSLPGLKYNYTRIEVVRKSCVNESSRRVGKRKYPDGTSFSDFRFDASVSNSEGRTTLGYFNPVSIGQTIYGNLFGRNGFSLPLVKEGSQNLQNISYEIHFTFSNASVSMNGAEKISAEGIYNVQTGLLCMTACRSEDSLADKQQISKIESADCEIVISIQFAPLNVKQGESLIGTVRSTRNKTDPLYFEPLKVSSFRLYKEQAIQSMWRMDIEVVMVMISLTLSCVFIGLQLFYVKKNPEVLPSVSITMLAILTLGHMIPLVLNFQALFRMSGRQNVLSRSGGWLEVNEVIVRVITMVAFLLQFRFLQLSWTARSSDERMKDLWTAEKNAIKMCLPLYFVGGLISWFSHMMMTRTQVGSPIVVDWPQDSLWRSLISYAGLILDGFLFPQVIFNIFSSSKDKGLSPSFYVGITVVRALPHAYDAYRSRHYVPRFNSSYLYARPQDDFYSLVWDIIIPCGGILLALLIYLQQRFGGTCFFPSKYASPRSYELVPIVSS